MVTDLEKYIKNPKDNLDHLCLDNQIKKENINIILKHQEDNALRITPLVALPGHVAQTTTWPRPSLLGGKAVVSMSRC